MRFVHDLSWRLADRGHSPAVLPYLAMVVATEVLCLLFDVRVPW